MRVVNEAENESVKGTAHLLSPAETARFLGVSSRHLRALNSCGRLPAPIRLGRCVRWCRAELVAWCEAGAPVRDEWHQIRGRNHVCT